MSNSDIAKCVILGAVALGLLYVGAQLMIDWICNAYRWRRARRRCRKG